MKYSTFNTKTSFGIGSLSFANAYHEHLELFCTGERFEWACPSLSFHGLVMGSPYMEIEGTGTLRDIKKPLEKYAVVNFHKRGWTKGSEHTFDAEVFSAKGKVAFKITGKWSGEISIQDMRNLASPEVIWTKQPYPENWQYQYGMTHFGLQLNYLPA